MAVKMAGYLTVYNLVVLVIAGVALYGWLLPHLVAEYKERLKVVANLVAQMVPTEKHQELVSGKLGENSNQYQEIKQILRQAKKSWDEIDDIYTMVPGKKMNEYQFAVEAMETEDTNGDGIIEEKETKAEFGEVYEVSQAPAMKLGMATVTVDDRPTKDKWGSFLSAYAPIRGSQGESVAMVGVDVRVDNYFNFERKVKLKIYQLLGLYFLSNILLGAWVTGMWSRPVVKTIDQVREAVGKEQVSLLPEDSGSQELDQLVGAVNKLIGKLIKSQRGLENEVDRRTVQLKRKIGELEKMMVLMVDREVKMAEMKKEIKNLSVKSVNDKKES
jgi:hypothetical protein